MNRKNFYYITRIHAALILGLATATVPAAEEEFSEANRALFFTDHLASITAPTTVEYDFRRTTTLGDGFEDQISIDIFKVHDDGTKDVRVNYFTGQRARHVPLSEHARGNPIVTVYLQRDIHQMDRATEGQWRYFQRRIKQALEESAELSPSTFELDGRTVAGTKIHIEPFAEDPNRDRYAERANKFYEFILSPEVPGQIYQIRSVTWEAGKGPADAPLIEESLTYHSPAK